MHTRLFQFPMQWRCSSQPCITTSFVRLTSFYTYLLFIDSPLNTRGRANDWRGKHLHCVIIGLRLLSCLVSISLTMKNKRRASTSHVWSIELGNRGAFLKRRNILSNLVLETAVGTHHGWTWCSVISWCCHSRDIAHTFPGTVNSAGSHSRRYFASRWAYQGQAWKNDGCNAVSYGSFSSRFRWLMSFIAELGKAKPCWSLFSAPTTGTVP